jgi:lysophospholipase L1-like esterase
MSRCHIRLSIATVVEQHHRMKIPSPLPGRLLLALLPVCLLLAHRIPGLAAEAGKGSDRWEPDIRAFEAADKTVPPPKGAILFIGSSSIRLWKTLARDFPEKQVINRGFGGSEIADSVFFADRIVFPYAPRMIVMYAGGNDINAGKPPEQVFADFREFAEKVRAKLPQTPIAYIAIAPNPARWSQVDRVKAANRLIADYANAGHRIEFIDVFTRMLGADGLPRPEIFVEDRLHMNAKGYELWREIVGPYLK